MFHFEDRGEVRSMCARICISVLLVIGMTAASLEAQTAKKPVNAAGQKLHDFLAAEWDYTMQQNPVYASLLGDRRFNDKWEDASISAYEARHQHDQQALKRLQQINRAQLNSADQLSYDLFKNKLEMAIE